MDGAFLYATIRTSWQASRVRRHRNAGESSRRIAAGMTDSKQPSETEPREKPYVPIEHRPLLGVPEAAALTGLDEKVVRNAICAGELIACYTGSSTKRVRRRDLDDWISSLPERPQ